MKLSFRFWFSVPVWVAGLSLNVHAQDARLAPKLPAPAEAPAALPPAPAAAVAAPADQDAVLVGSLDGLVFLGDRVAVQPAGIGRPGVTCEGLLLLQQPAFQRLAAAALGRPVTLRMLNELTRQVVLFYREQGRPVVDVFVPEQNISSGTVQILVLEGRVGQVRAEGNAHFSSALLTGQVRLRPGEPIASEPLLADLVWLNRNPFRQVDLVFARGVQPGETDIVLRTRDRFPLRVFAGYEDSGNAVTGEDRVLAGVNWGNAFGRDQQMNYQLTASPDFSQLVAHSASYLVPLPGRHTLTIFGSYATSRPDLGTGYFKLKGSSWQTSARYGVPLASTHERFSHELSAGVDFKRSNNNLLFGGLQVFDQWTDVVQAVADYNAQLADRWGRTTLDVQGVWSPGGLSANNHTRNFRDARAYAESDYAYARATLGRTILLPRGASWVARLTAQVASANLLGSEQLGLGGYENLRGYEEREANGDNAWVLTNELHLPAFSPMRLLGGGRLTDRLEVLGFVDYGEASSHRLLPGEDAHLVLASVGGGLRYNVAPYLNVRCDYGHQLLDSGVSDGRRSSRFHLGVVVAY